MKANALQNSRIHMNPIQLTSGGVAMSIFTFFASVLLVSGCATRSGPATLAPVSGSVEIRGEVARPGNYPYRMGMKVADLVNDAGGLTAWGSGISVVRGGTNLVDGYYGGPKRAIKSEYMSTPLEAEDLVKVRPMQ